MVVVHFVTAVIVAVVVAVVVVDSVARGLPHTTLRLP